MNNLIDIELDPIELERLEQFSGINNISPEEAASILICQRLQQWADDIVDDEISIFKH